MRSSLPSFVGAFLVMGMMASGPVPGAAQSCRRPCVGPTSGSVVAAGGGRLGDDIFRRFVSLAGGPGAEVILIPTAAADGESALDGKDGRRLRAVGATVTVVHTRARRVANSPAFVEPLTRADGVWFAGGRQWRLVDAYLGTRAHVEIRRLLERGGVVGGTSAGASILASYLVRGAIEGNEIVMAPGYEEGFGILRGVAVDQHLLARGRQDDLFEVLDVYPHLLGIGLDEGTAIVVQGDRAEVLGRSKVAVYDAATAGPAPLHWLEPGDVYDLGVRRLVGAADAGGRR